MTKTTAEAIKLLVAFLEDSGVTEFEGEGLKIRFGQKPLAMTELDRAELAAEADRPPPDDMWKDPDMYPDGQVPTLGGGEA